MKKFLIAHESGLSTAENLREHGSLFSIGGVIVVLFLFAIVTIVFERITG